MARPRVVITEPIDAGALAWLRDRCDVLQPDCSDGASLGDALAGAEGLIVRTYTRVNKALLDRAPRLRVVGRAGVGLDNLDLAACEARGIAVVSTPDANTGAVVEYVFSMIFRVVRPLAPLDRALAPIEWRTLRDSSLAPSELGEMTLGILGLGRIGKAVARAGAALMGRVIYHDLLDIPRELRSGAEAVDRATLLAQSDILTIHVDGRASNRHLVDAEALALVKPTAIFINASRGFVVDALALAAFLKDRPRAVSILDVHDPEPIGADSPLLGLPNAILTPHLAAATCRAKKNMSWVVKDVWEALTIG